MEQRAREVLHPARIALLGRAPVPTDGLDRIRARIAQLEQRAQVVLRDAEALLRCLAVPEGGDRGVGVDTQAALVGHAVQVLRVALAAARSAFEPRHGALGIGRHAAPEEQDRAEAGLRDAAALLCRPLQPDDLLLRVGLAAGRAGPGLVRTRNPQLRAKVAPLCVREHSRELLGRGLDLGRGRLRTGAGQRDRNREQEGGSGSQHRHRGGLRRAARERSPPCARCPGGPAA